MGSVVLALIRLTGYLAITLTLAPLQAVFKALRLPARRELPRRYHRICGHILGFRIKVRGQISDRSPVLFVSNHLSYLDIIVLGGMLPGSFVAKSEVAKWPFFGPLSKLQNTVYVDRRPSSTREQKDSLASRLSDGGNLILFPEGTSNDGNRTLPFKSALFASAAVRTDDDRPVTVQPVSIAVTDLDGWPIGRHFRSVYAWYGDMDLLSHIWRVAGVGRLTIQVQFHEPVTLEQFGSRKQLADHCWTQVAGAMARANAGRPQLENAVGAPA